MAEIDSLATRRKHRITLCEHQMCHHADALLTTDSFTVDQKDAALALVDGQYGYAVVEQPPSLPCRYCDLQERPRC